MLVPTSNLSQTDFIELNSWIIRRKGLCKLDDELKNAQKNWGFPFLFHHKKTAKGKFWLQMIILREGTWEVARPTTF